MQRQLRFELRTRSSYVPTASVREWIRYVHAEPPPPDNESTPLEWWLQILTKKYPTQVPKDAILPRLLVVYHVQSTNQ